MKKNYNRNCHNVTNLNYHIILCSKYRKPYLLKNEVRLLSCFRKTTIKYGSVIKEIEVMPDHIHIFLSVYKHRNFCLSKFVKHLKGPGLRQGQNIWFGSAK